MTDEPTLHEHVAEINALLTQPRFHVPCGQSHVPGPCLDGVTRHGEPQEKDDLRSLLGEAVFLAAADLGYTQADLALAVGVSTKHMSLSLRGKGGSPDFYDRCASALGKRWEVRLV